MIYKLSLFGSPFLMVWDLYHDPKWLPFPICSFIVCLLVVIGDD